MASGEHRLIKLGRRYGHGGDGIVSTVSLNRDVMAGAEHPGCMPQWRIRHRLVIPGRRYERGGCDLGASAVTVNGTISTDCKRDNQHRVQMGQNMRGGEFSGRLDRVGFWAGFSFVFSFLWRFSFLLLLLVSFAHWGLR
jgi:hypothetical protein